MTKATTFAVPALALFLIQFAAGAGATTRTVPGDFPTIQGALNASAAGDTVVVSPGTYTENINVPSGILLRSLTSVATTIDGGFAAATVTLNGVTAVEIDGFQIVNGSSSGAGGGISATNSSAVIRECGVIGNSALTVGGGIGLDNSTLDVEQCEVSANYTLVGGGAGIAVMNGSDLTLNRSWVHYNSVSTSFGSGGGIYLDAGTMATITYNLIIFNFADAVYGPGGGIYCGTSNALIDHNTIVDNGFFIFGLNPPPPHTFPSLPASGNPGLGTGIYFASSAAAASNNIIGTVAPGSLPSAGTAVDCSTGSSPFLSNNDVWNNDVNNPSPEYGAGCGDPTGTDGNISADPRFCDPLHNNYTLYNVSPCVGAGTGGSNIGAFAVGCGITPTAPRTWGAVKRIFQ